MKQVQKMISVFAVLFLILQFLPTAGLAAAGDPDISMDFESLNEGVLPMSDKGDGGSGWFLRTNSWADPDMATVSHGIAAVPLTGSKALKITGSSTTGTIDIYNDAGYRHGDIIDVTKQEPYRFSVDMMLGGDNNSGWKGDAEIQADGLRFVRFRSDGKITVGKGGDDYLGAPVGTWVKGKWYHITAVFHANTDGFVGDLYIDGMKTAENISFGWSGGNKKNLYIKTYPTGAAFDTYVDNLELAAMSGGDEYIPEPSKLSSPHLYDGVFYYNFGGSRATVKNVLDSISNPDGNALSVVGPCDNAKAYGDHPDTPPWYNLREDGYSDLRWSFLLERDAVSGKLLHMFPISYLGTNAASMPLDFTDPADLYAGRVMIDFKWLVDSHDIARLCAGTGGKRDNDRAAMFSFSEENYGNDYRQSLDYGSSDNNPYYEAEDVDGVTRYYRAIKPYWEPSGMAAAMSGAGEKDFYFSFQVMLDSYDYAVKPRFGNTSLFPVKFDRDGVLKAGQNLTAVGRWETNRWYTVDVVCRPQDGKVYGDIYLDGKMAAAHILCSDSIPAASSYSCIYMTILGNEDQEALIPGTVYLDNIKAGMVSGTYVPAASRLASDRLLGRTLFADKGMTAAELKAAVTAEGRSLKIYDRNYTELSDSAAVPNGGWLVETDAADSSVLFAYAVRTGAPTKILIDKELRSLSVAADAAQEVPADGRIFLAGYDGTGALCAVVLGSIAGGEAAYDAGREVYTRAVTLEGEYPAEAASVRAFLWNSLTDLTPVCAPAE